MLNHLKIGVRLVLGFLIIAVLVVLVSVFAIMQLNKLQEPLVKDIPKGLVEIEKTSKLDSLSKSIRYYDQVLTDAARKYVYTQNTGWKKLYNRFAPELDLAINEAIENGDAQDKEIFSKINEAKEKFKQVEWESMQVAERGYWVRARELLEGEDYWQSKESYRQGLKAYVESRGKKHGQSLEVTAGNVDQIVKETLELLQRSLRLVTMISILAFVLAVVFGLSVARSIVSPIRQLQKGARLMGEGVLDYRIDIDSNDEIAELGNSFNEMGIQLKESYEGLEEKVRQKTRALSQKVIEIQAVMMDLEAAKNNVEREKVGYEALLASIGDGMVATDKAGHILMMNHQCEVMLGIESKKTVGKIITQCIRCVNDKGEPVQEHLQPIGQALTTRRKIMMIANYVPQSGPAFPAAITVSPVILGGKLIGAVQIFRDITKEKEVDRMKTEFISTVSHELRTPMTVIREGTALVMEGVLGETTKEQKEALGLSLDSIDRLRRIIDSLLDVSKIEAGRLEVMMDIVAMKPLIEEIKKMFDQKVKARHIELKASYLGRPTEIHADRDKLTQVFVNIIGNALKFTEKGIIELKLEDKDDHILCSVEDTGPGISKEDLPKVFGKFKQLGQKAATGERGTGLGLSIAKGIVELHKGRIWVESTLGKGTTFRFTLPKHKTIDLVTEYVQRNIKEAMRYGTIFSVVHLKLHGMESMKNKIGPGQMHEAMTQLERLMKKGLRRQADATIRNENSLYMILPSASKKDASQVTDRMGSAFNDFLMQKGFDKQLQFTSRIATYPDEGTECEAVMMLLAEG